MLYNKNSVRKTNDKKILHKVGKQWKVVSVALLMAIGGGAAVAATNNTSANADVNVNDATQVKNEAAELENDTFNKPASASASSSAASKSTAAPSLASYSYAPSARVSGHNADAAYYNNNYEFNQQEVSYYGPTVKSYVNSINARFPEAKNLQNSYNSASTSAVDATSAAKSYANAAATPANGSIINAMAAKAGLTSSDFISSVKAATLSYSSQVSNGSAENSAIGFVNSLVNEVLNGNPSQSAANASYTAETANASYLSAEIVSSADQRNYDAVSDANSLNQSALDAANSASEVAAGRAQVARIFSGVDVDATNSAARVASGISNGGSVNSSAMSSAISALASAANISAGSNAQFVFNVDGINGTTNNDAYDANYVKNGLDTIALHVGSYALNSDTTSNGQSNMVRVISDTAALSAQASVSSSAASVIASAKAYKSAHANDLSSAAAQSRNDKSAVSSAYNAYEMAMANNLISTDIANGVGENGSDAVGYLNGLLRKDDLAAYFGGIAESDTTSYQDFAGSDAKANLFNNMSSSASAASVAAAKNHATVSTEYNNEENSSAAIKAVNDFLTNYSENDLGSQVKSLSNYANSNHASKPTLSGNTSALSLFTSVYNSVGLNSLNDASMSNTFSSGVTSATLSSVNGTKVDDKFSNVAIDNYSNFASTVSSVATTTGHKDSVSAGLNAVASASQHNLSDIVTALSTAKDDYTGGNPTGVAASKINAYYASSAVSAMNSLAPTDVASASSYGITVSNGSSTPLRNSFNALSDAVAGLSASAHTVLTSDTASGSALTTQSTSAKNADSSASNEVTSLNTAYTNAHSDAAKAFDNLQDATGYTNQTNAVNNLKSDASAAFESAALASGSAEGVDFSILSAGSGQSAYSEYGSAVASAETSLNNNTGASHVASQTSANLSDAMSLAESSANSSYDSVVSASAKYSGDEDVNVTLAGYFASSYSNDASSEANLANSASNALNSLYLDKADNATASAYTHYNSALAAENGNKTLAHANGIFVLHNSPQFITLTKNAELHDAVLFNKKTALRSAKAGEQFAVKGVAFDKVGTLRYVVGTTKDGGYVYVTANDNYVENSYLEPDANYTVKLLRGANVHATKNFSSKVIKHLPKGTEFTGQAVPTLNVDHTYNYYYGVSRLAAFGGYVTANVNVVQNMPQNNNNNNNSSAASNNQKPAGNPANLVLFK